MKFYFQKIALWLSNNTTRTLEFVPNKINVITGESNTGKTSILDIIDYCLFSSKPQIPESIINENVNWYGISFAINEKNYTICRRAPERNQPSSDYYFSSIGDIPITPEINIKEESLKELLETEFHINKNVKVQFGGQAIRADTKISLRYFLLFNAITQDVITHSKVFFDKQNEPRYREALPRIFDLAVGIDTVDNILKREKKEELEKELNLFDKKEERITKKRNEFIAELEGIIKKAKEYSLIEPDEKYEGAVKKLKIIVSEYITSLSSESSKRYQEISKEIYNLNRKIINMKRFLKEYSNYKDNLKDIQESIKPVLFLKKKNSELVKTSIFCRLIDSLENDFYTIKETIKTKSPMDSKVTELIEDYERRIRDLKEESNLFPDEVKNFNNDLEKYIFIGEMKAKFDLYYKEGNSLSENVLSKKEEIQKTLENLNVKDVSTNRELFIKLLEEIIQDYIRFSKNALDNYGNYLPVFNYKEKKLELRKPKTDFIDNVGSSSNHMFLKLFLFLGIHEAILQKKIPYVPSYLIIDQPSRPYYGDEEDKRNTNESDEFKIVTAFSLLNDFLKRIIIEQKQDFQIVIFEHIPIRILKEIEYVHIVDEFKDGNALIPRSFFNKNEDI